MKILLTGGGTGGHITPILAVAHELKQLDPTCHVIYVGEKGGKFAELTSDNPDIDEVYAVRAGKFRRYNGESFFTRLTDVKTNSLNVRDSLYVSLGVAQAARLLRKLKPDVVFLKGGFVGVPMGLAAAAQRLPIITHDSDALPGLANRLVSRWAKQHATALDADVYSYPKSKVVPVGVLVEHSFQPVSDDQLRQFKAQIDLDPDESVLLITGGSSGAQRINEAVRSGIQKLLADFPDLQVIHQVGKGNKPLYDALVHDNYHVLEFLHPMYVYMGAADLVVARASANTIAELGVQGKAVIAIPSPFLAGGHQLKNAELLAEQGVAIVVREEQMYDQEQGLIATIEKLLADSNLRHALSKKLQSQTIPDAAHRLAVLLLEQASSKSKIKSKK